MKRDNEQSIAKLADTDRIGDLAPLPTPPKEPCRLILLGAPGVGKGTQADLLHKWCGACHLSTGDIFRAAQGLPAAELTPALKSALGFMRRGELVPDATVLALVNDRVRCLHCAGGFLLDGFPRTVAQAESLAQLLQAENLPLTAVIDYELSRDKTVERLGSRRVCASCNNVFHMTGQSASPEICPLCGGKLYQRDDDRPEAVRVRMEAYHRNTEPLVKFYRRRNLLLAISAAGTPPEVFQQTVEALAHLETRPKPGA